MSRQPGSQYWGTGSELKIRKSEDKATTYYLKLSKKEQKEQDKANKKEEDDQTLKRLGKFNMIVEKTKEKQNGDNV